MLISKQSTINNRQVIVVDDLIQKDLCDYLIKLSENQGKYKKTTFGGKQNVHRWTVTDKLLSDFFI